MAGFRRTAGFLQKTEKRAELLDFLKSREKCGKFENPGKMWEI
jgi:hypothetical protein